MPAPTGVATPADPEVRADQGGSTWLGPASVEARLRLGYLVFVVAVLGAALAAGSAPAGVRAPIVLLAATLLPGYPLVVRFHVDIVTLLALDVCVSLSVEAALAFVSVESGIWHPLALSLLIAVVFSALTLSAIQRLRAELGPPRTTSNLPRERSYLSAAGWAAPAVALLLWIVTLLRTDANNLKPWGLLPAFSPAYWLAAGLIVGSAVLLSQAARLRHGPLLAHLGVLLTLLYATAPALEDAPRYTFAYKHIAVTQYIELYGSVDNSIDIYHRWPGFFSLAAVFSQASGLPDPGSYAAWAEIYFASVDALLVWAVAYAVTRSTRLAWCAALLFTISNWVGQDYYSPQAFGFVLMLGILLAVLTLLRGDPNRFGRWLERLVVRLFRIRTPPVTPPIMIRSASLLHVASLVILMDFVLVASHQLTPYVLLMQLGALMLSGYLKPWWIVLAASAVTLAYLLPNFHFVVTKFGLFSTSDPLANATQKIVTGTPDFAQQSISRIAVAVILVVFVLGFVGMLRRARAGHVREALLLALLAFIPPFLLLVQSYGGEARLRVFLFALPWCCTGLSWAWAPDGHRVPARRMWAPLLVSGLLGTGFVFLFFGREDLNHLTQDEVGAAARLFDPHHSPAGTVVMLSAPNFPAQFGPLYFRLSTIELPSLDTSGFTLRRSLVHAGPSDVDAAAKLITDLGGSERYLVFSQGEQAYARDYALYAPGALPSFEAAVAVSPRFQLVYNTPTARIFKLLG